MKLIHTVAECVDFALSTVIFSAELGWLSYRRAGLVNFGVKLNPASQGRDCRMQMRKAVNNLITQKLSEIRKQPDEEGWVTIEQPINEFGRSLGIVGISIETKNPGLHKKEILGDFN